MDSLNESQKAAVMNNENVLQIIAGPGSGKTRVLVCRVAYLILVKNINPSSIVVVTFTRKATEELKERLISMIGQEDTERCTVNTFHGFCTSLLKKHASLLGLKSNFSTLSGYTRRCAIMRELVNDESILPAHADRQIQISHVLEEIDNAMDRGENWIKFQNLYGHLENRNLKRVVAVLYKAYELELKEMNMVDLNSLVLKTCDLLNTKHDVTYHVGAILVDEFQDTSDVQYAFIKLLLKQHGSRSLTVVGDPDQSIYGWRAAKKKIFEKMAEEMEEEEKEMQIIHLMENYRSSQYILSAANFALSQEEDKSDFATPKPFTNNTADVPMTLLSTRNEYKQAEFVAFEISKAIDYAKGLLEYKDVAVLMRSNSSSEQFERMFRVHGIPFKIKKGKFFFEREEIQGVIAFLKLAVCPWDTISFNKVINIPRKLVRQKTIDEIDILTAQTNDYLVAIKYLIEECYKHQFNADRKPLENLLELFRQIKQMMNTKVEVADILLFIFEETNFFQHLKMQSFKDHTLKWKNLDELVSIARTRHQFFRKEKAPAAPEEEYYYEYSAEFGQEHDDDEEKDARSSPVEDFLAFCQNCLDESRKEQVEKKGGYVTISTIHSAKGLEWPLVFIVTCVNGVIPTPNSDQLEEWRILYVAMTRAKFLLYCISPIEITHLGSPIKPGVTSVLNNMPKKFCSRTPPVWNQQMRVMLASILDKPVPAEESFLNNSVVPTTSSTQPAIVIRKRKLESFLLNTQK